jgi:hypothetical protein
VKVNAAHWPVVLVEALEEHSHAAVQTQEAQNDKSSFMLKVARRLARWSTY